MDLIGVLASLVSHSQPQSDLSDQSDSSDLSDQSDSSDSSDTPKKLVDPKTC